MNQKVLLAGAAVAIAAGAVTFALAQKKYTIVTVVKITGINWFNRMEEGVKQYATDSGNNIRYPDGRLVATNRGDLIKNARARIHRDINDSDRCRALDDERACAR